MPWHSMCARVCLCGQKTDGCWDLYFTPFSAGGLNVPHWSCKIFQNFTSGQKKSQRKLVDWQVNNSHSVERQKRQSEGGCMSKMRVAWQQGRQGPKRSSDDSVWIPCISLLRWSGSIQAGEGLKLLSDRWHSRQSVDLGPRQRAQEEWHGLHFWREIQFQLLLLLLHVNKKSYFILPFTWSSSSK